METKKPNLLFSCLYASMPDDVQIVPELSLNFVLSGKMELQFAHDKIFLEPGSITLLRKNELVKATRMPDENGQAYKAATLFLTQEILRDYASKHGILAGERYFGKPILDLGSSHFLNGYFESLFPYFDRPESLTDEMMALKTSEAIALLIDFDPKLKLMLFDFNDPFKIDLEKFMNRNFAFHVPIQEFARLTGRSLSTFKRDFKKIYENTPERWLRERRLDEAKSLLGNGMRPSEIYHAVGFDNFSHFSTAFRSRFGHPPSVKN